MNALPQRRCFAVLPLLVLAACGPDTASNDDTGSGGGSDEGATLPTGGSDVLVTHENVDIPPRTSASCSRSIRRAGVT